MAAQSRNRQTKVLLIVFTIELTLAARPLGGLLRVLQAEFAPWTT